ncbi:MAG TPA: ribulose-phosphate 3-epimerase [Clostridia bacterium]|nr:ribulose-phosphate 3-epimerase [Clostridia bacterium]
MIKLAPSILSADFSCLGDQIREVENAGVEYLHIDVMDGHFVPNITIGPLIVEAVRPHSKLFFDVHLMIENPDQYIEAFAQAGSDLITVHAEACTHLHRSICLIKEQGVRAGVALNPATPLNDIEYVLPFVDLVLLMTVNPGFGGQKFIPEVLPKIKALKHLLGERDLNPEIQVDGGVNTNTAPGLVEAGVDVLVAGSAIFGTGNIEKAVKDLRLAIDRNDR